MFVGVKQILHAFQMQKNSNMQPIHPFQHWIDELPKKLLISDDTVTQFTNNFTSKLNSAISSLVKLLLVESFTNSGSFVLFLYVFSKVFAKFTLIRLFQVIWIGVFTCPVVYQMKKQEIDQALGKIWAPAKPHVDRLLELVNKFQCAQAQQVSEKEE